MTDDLGLDLPTLTARSLAYALLCPSRGGWALTEEACRFVGAFVQWWRPSRVLEFGSGFSTLVVAAELTHGKHGALDSIDNSVYWSAAAREMACERVEFHRFPLGLRSYRGFPCVFYRIPPAFYRLRAPYDLVIVDGPHHDVGRDGALPESLVRLRTGGYVLLDDCHSGHMQRTLAKWRTLFGPSITEAKVLDIGKGLGIIRKLADAPLRLRSLSVARLVQEWLRAGRNLSRIGRLGLNTE